MRTHAAFDNPFSPFARKVRLVLDWKGLAYDVIDGLDKANARALEAANGRAEVPALIDGDVTVVNSSDIVAYLEHTHPERPVYPAEPAARVRARAWERCADDDRPDPGRHLVLVLGRAAGPDAGGHDGSRASGPRSDL